MGIIHQYCSVVFIFKTSYNPSTSNFITVVGFFHYLFHYFYKKFSEINTSLHLLRNNETTKSQCQKTNIINFHCVYILTSIYGNIYIYQCLCM